VGEVEQQSPHSSVEAGPWWVPTLNSEKNRLVNESLEAAVVVARATGGRLRWTGRNGVELTLRLIDEVDLQHL